MWRVFLISAHRNTAVAMESERLVMRSAISYLSDIGVLFFERSL
jgi:hypothetical protein